MISTLLIIVAAMWAVFGFLWFLSFTDWKELNWGRKKVFLRVVLSGPILWACMILIGVLLVISKLIGSRKSPDGRNYPPLS